MTICREVEILATDETRMLLTKELFAFLRVASRATSLEHVLYVKGSIEGGDVAPAGTKKARGMRRGLGNNRINYA
jgi:hypothetical protein